jgi:hypothetical protein
MSTPNPSPSQPDSSQSSPSQPTKKKIDPRGIFLLLIMIMVAGYLIAIHHTPSLVKTNTLNKTNVLTNTSAILNGSIPGLQNVMAINFNLTNSMQENELIVSKNGEIYLQISGYFNQFPNSYPKSLYGKPFIIYMEITVYKRYTS